MNFRLFMMCFHFSITFESQIENQIRDYMLLRAYGFPVTMETSVHSPVLLSHSYLQSYFIVCKCICHHHEYIDEILLM